MTEFNASIKISADAKSAIAGFFKLQKSLEQTKKKIDETQREINELARRVQATGGKDAGLVKQFEAAKKKAKELKNTYKLQQAELAKTQKTLRRLGVDNARLAQSAKPLATAWRNIALTISKSRSEIVRLNREQHKLGKSLGDMKGQLIAAFAPLAGLGFVAKSGAGGLLSLEEKLAEIRTLTNSSVGASEVLGKSLRQMSQDFGKDVVDLADSMYNIISAGVDSSDSLNVLEIATKAATAGIADVNETASLGLAIMRSYGKGVDDLEGIYDVLFKTVKNGVTTIPEMGASLARLLPTAVAAGVSFETLSAALAQLTQQWGGQTAQAVTALNSVIFQLSAPTKESAQRMRELGIEWTNLADTLKQIKEADIDIERLRTIIPDQEGAKAVLSLAHSYEILGEKIDEAVKAAGAMAEAFGIIYEGRDAEFKRMVQVWGEFKRELGELLLTLTPVIEGFVELLKFFNELKPATQAYLVGLVALPAAIIAAKIALKGLIFALGRTIALNPKFLAVLAAVSAAVAAYEYLFPDIEAEIKAKEIDRLTKALARYQKQNKLLEINTSGLDQKALLKAERQLDLQISRLKEVAKLTGVKQTSQLAQYKAKLQEVTDAQVTLDNFSGDYAGLRLFNTLVNASEEGIQKFKEQFNAFVDRDYQSELKKINGAFEENARILKEADKTEELVTLEKKRTIEIIALERHRASETIRIAERVSVERLALLSKEGRHDKVNAGDRKRIYEELANEKINAQRRVVDALGSELERAKSKEREYADQAIDLQKQIADERIRQQQAINELGRAGLTPLKRYRDIAAEIAQLGSQAQSALRAGDEERALQYARRREQLAKSIAGQEIKSADGARVLVSSDRSRSQALNVINDTHRLINQALDQQRKKAERAKGFSEIFNCQFNDL